MKYIRAIASRRVVLEGGGSAAVSIETEIEWQDNPAECLRQLQDAVDHEVVEWASRLGDRVVCADQPT